MRSIYGGRRHDLAAGEPNPADCAGGTVAEQDPVDGGVVPDLDPGSLRCAGQRHRQGVHATVGHEHAVDGVHVGDHGVDGERLVRGQAGIHRLEAEDAAQALVVEVARDRAGKLAERAEADQLQRRPKRPGQVERRVIAALNEAGHLEVVEPREPAAEAAERVGLARPAHGPDLLDHGVPTVADAQLGAVGELGPVHRVDGTQREDVGHLDADGAETPLDELRHGEHGGAGVEPVAAALERAGPTARHAGRLKHDHLVTGAGQVAGGRQAAEPGAHHDHQRVFGHQQRRSMAEAASCSSAVRAGSSIPAMAARAI